MEKSESQGKDLHPDRSKDRYFREILDLSTACIICDRHGNVLFANELFSKISGYSSAELIGRQQSLLGNTLTDAKFAKELYEVIQTKGHWQNRVSVLNKNGLELNLDLRIFEVSKSSGFPDALVFIINQIGIPGQDLASDAVFAEKTIVGSKQSNENLTRLASAVIERVSDAFVALDRNWRYTYMNQKAGEIFARDPAEMIGKHIWTEFPEGIGQPFYQAYHKALEEQTYIYLEEYYPPYNLWFENHIYPSPDGLTIYFKDISERKRAEQELLREKNLSESIINSLPGAFYMYDNSGRFVKWNENFEKVSGYSADEIRLMNPLDFFDSDEKDILASRIKEVFEKGSSDIEAHMFTKDRRKIPFYFNGHAISIDGTEYLLGVGIDISERKRTERSYMESEAKYKYLFNNNPALIIIWDIETLAILEVNDMALELYGYSREEFLNMNVLDLRPPEDREKIRNFSKTMLTSPEYKVRRTWRHLKKNGEIVYMDITSHRIDYNNRKVILSLAKDITEQRHAEERLKETYDDIRRLNAHLQTLREEERTSIAREIHDELGQQLTGLKMDASWLSRKLENSDERIVLKLKEMISLMDETIKTVRRISSDLRPGILDDLGLIAALEWQSSEFEKRSGIKVEFSAEIKDLKTDRKTNIAIFRIFQESLTNAMRHSGAGTLSCSLKEDGKFLTMSIRDDGKGFDAETARKKKTLGLTGMRERALMIGGKMTVSSQSGKGTLIEFKLPLNGTKT